MTKLSMPNVCSVTGGEQPRGAFGRRGAEQPALQQAAVVALALPPLLTRRARPALADHRPPATLFANDVHYTASPTAKQVEAKLLF